MKTRFNGVHFIDYYKKVPTFYCISKKSNKNHLKQLERDFNYFLLKFMNSRRKISPIHTGSIFISNLIFKNLKKYGLNGHFQDVELLERFRKDFKYLKKHYSNQNYYSAISYLEVRIANPKKSIHFDEKMKKSIFFSSPSFCFRFRRYDSQKI